MFFIMDGRARFDQGRAVIVSVCDTVKEALQEMKEDYQGYDYVIVDVSTNKVVYDPMNRAGAVEGKNNKNTKGGSG
jgi:hypothetical protein